MQSNDNSNDQYYDKHNTATYRAEDGNNDDLFLKGERRGGGGRGGEDEEVEESGREEQGECKKMKVKGNEGRGERV